MMFLLLIVMLLSANDSVYFVKHQWMCMSTFWHWKNACLQNSNQRTGHQTSLLLVKGMMRLYTAQCKRFGICSTQHKSRKPLHAQYAAALLQGKDHSANSWCNFQIHNEATPTNQKCTLNSLIQHHFEPEDVPDYECLTCSRRTLATQRLQISHYPVILCIILGRKMNDETRITSAVNYPVIALNQCTFFGSHEGTVDLKYNLIATVNHKPSKKNDGHYTAGNKSPTLRSWYKYDNDIVNLVKFM